MISITNFSKLECTAFVKLIFKAKKIFFFMGYVVFLKQFIPKEFQKW